MPEANSQRGERASARVGAGAQGSAPRTADTDIAHADGWATAERFGIHRLAIPTPFAVGRVNVLLIDDEPLTLVDTGPNSGTSLNALERGLAALGRRIEDIKLVLVTHQHIDHTGLVRIVAERSGAEVAALDATVPFIERYREEAEAEDAFAHAMMLRHGIPSDVATALQSVSRSFRGWGASGPVHRVLRDGDIVELAQRRLRVLHRPGHSLSDTVFLDEQRGVAILGDHLLAHISSNPLLARPREGERERPRVLVRYLESLSRTRELDFALGLPGHGETIADHRALIDERFALHQRRAEKIRRLIAQQPRTAYEIAQELWGNVAVTQAYLTLSEVLGHLDLLLAEGRAREIEADGIVRFEAAET